MITNKQTNKKSNIEREELFELNKYWKSYPACPARPTHVTKATNRTILIKWDLG